MNAKGILTMLKKAGKPQTAGHMRSQLRLSLALARFVNPAPIQSKPSCAGGSDWQRDQPPLRLDEDGSPRRLPQPLTTEQVRDALEREFDLIEVPTQGVEKRIAWRHRLTLVRPIPDTANRCRGRPCKLHTPLVGARLRPSMRISPDSLARRQVPRTDLIEVWHNDSSGVVQMWLEPMTLDGGTLYYVFAISDSGFMGGWTDGGYIASLMTIDGVEIVEKLQGYFCALRVR